MTLYAYRVAAEARQTASALTAAELVLARAQHLSQIDGLAAAAAHELGTPLATVALVVREMAAQPHADEDFRDDLRLLEQSVERCRSILGKLSAPAELSGQQMDISSPVELAEIAAAPHRLRGVGISVEGEGPEPPPKCPRVPGCLYRPRQPDRKCGQFRRKGGGDSGELDQIDGQDHHSGRWTRAFRRMFSPGSASPISRSATGRRRKQEAGGGLGLGLFIARSLLERSRATLQFGNAAPPATGAVVTVSGLAPPTSRVDGRTNSL